MRRGGCYLIKVLTDLDSPSFRTGYRHLGPYGPKRDMKAKAALSNGARSKIRNPRHSPSSEHASLQVRKDLHVYRKYGHDEKLRSVRTLIAITLRRDLIKVLTDLDISSFRSCYRHLGLYRPRGET